MSDKKLCLRLAVLIGIGLAGASAGAQSVLAPLFARLKSPDPTVRAAAQKDSFRILDEAEANLQAEIPTLQAALTDQDPYIRLQASAILFLQSYYRKKNADVVIACLPELIQATHDPKMRVSQDSLGAIVYMQGGTPPSSTSALLEALKNSDNNMKSIAAVGLLRSTNLTAEIAAALQQQIRDAFNSDTKKALLNALLVAGPVSDTVADEAATYLNDHDPTVQEAAVDTLPRAYKTPSLARDRLTNLLDSGKVSPALKKQIEGALARLSGASGAPK